MKKDRADRLLSELGIEEDPLAGSYITQRQIVQKHLTFVYKEGLERAARWLEATSQIEGLVKAIRALTKEANCG